MLMESPRAVSSRMPTTSECDSLVLGRHEPSFSPPAAVQTGPLQRLAQARSVSGNDCMNSRTAAIWLFSEMNSNEDALTARTREPREEFIRKRRDPPFRSGPSQFGAACRVIHHSQRTDQTITQRRESLTSSSGSLCCFRFVLNNANGFPPRLGSGYRLWTHGTWTHKPCR